MDNQYFVTPKQVREQEWEEIQELINTAISLLLKASVQLEKTGRTDKMYKVNQTIHKLREVE